MYEYKQSPHDLNDFIYSMLFCHMSVNGRDERLKRKSNFYVHQCRRYPGHRYNFDSRERKLERTKNKKKKERFYQLTATRPKNERKLL